MKLQTSQITRYRMKEPGIYQSEHEPFLPGNIAKRGVIGNISRKAISPLAEPVAADCRRINLSFLFLKIYSDSRERTVARPYQKRLTDHRKPDRLQNRDLLFLPPEDYIRYD